MEGRQREKERGKPAKGEMAEQKTVRRKKEVELVIDFVGGNSALSVMWRVFIKLS